MRYPLIFAGFLAGLVATSNGLAQDWRSATQMSKAATALLHGLGIVLGRLPMAGLARAGGGAIAAVGAVFLLA